MAGGASDSDDEITGINVTPLVDVMLVLLIIFMVTATYIVNQSINVNLPKAQTADPSTQSLTVAFVLDAEGRLAMAGKPVEFAELAGKIAEEKAKAGDKGISAVIAADTKTPHGFVIKLIDNIRKNGINDFAINVEAEAPSAQ